MYCKRWLVLFVVFLIEIQINNVNATTEISPTTSPNSSEETLAPSGGSESCKSNCIQTVCTESKITFVRHSAKYVWKINGLRKYIKLSETVDSTMELSTKVKLETLHPEGGEWVFKLQGDSPMELRATFIFINQPTFDGYRLQEQSMPSKDSNFEIGIIAIEGDSTITLTPKVSSPTISGGYYELTFIWRDFDASVLEPSTDKTDDIELQFLISSLTLNAINSTKVECNQMQQSETVELPLLPSLPPFASQISNIMKDDKYADLVIKTGDEEFKVHRVIFANSSPVFATMIFNKTFDKSESLLDLGAEIGPDVVEELIRYVYTGKIDDIEEIADRIIVAAYKYGFPELKKQCELALVKQVRTDNAFSIYSLAVEVQADKLRKKAFNLMKDNKSQIVNQTEEFRKLSVHHPEIMYELFLS